MYIAGGIAPKLLRFITRNNLFWEHFVKKGRMQALLEKVPLFIVTNPAVGLLGAKVVCRRLLRKQGFLPGRGELPSFTEATPRSMALATSFGEAFSFPEMNESNQFGGAGLETEVTLEPTTKQPERVVIRRARTLEQQQHDQQRRASLTYAQHTTNRRDEPSASSASSINAVAKAAFSYGLLGGAVASVLAIASISLFGYIAAHKRSPYAPSNSRM